MKELEIRDLDVRLETEGAFMLPEGQTELLRNLRRDLKAIPDDLPSKALTEKLNYFRIHPLVNELEILRHQVIHGTFSNEQIEALSANERKYQEFARTQPTQQVIATDLGYPVLKAARFNPTRHSKKELEYIMYQIGACYQDKRRLPEIIEAFYQDSLVGGSITVTVERAKSQQPRVADSSGKKKTDDTIQAVGRFFVGLDRQDQPILTADLFTSGDYHSRSIQRWIDAGKGGLFAFAPAAHLYLADKLGINRLVYADPAMVEFARRAGIGSQTVFDRRGRHGSRPDQRKVGVIAVPDNSKGVWQSSMYGNSGRLPTLDYSEISIDALFWELEQTARGIEQDMPSGRLPDGYDRKLRITPRFEVMFTILRIMEDAFLGNPKFARGKQMYNHTVDNVKTHDRDFARSYVK